MTTQQCMDVTPFSFYDFKKQSTGGLIHEQRHRIIET